ncbi:cytochrome c oxidase subunit CcoM [Halomonas sp. WWR20]
MYWDDAVIFGLGAVGLLIAFMGGLGWLVIRDSKRNGKK